MNVAIYREKDIKKSYNKGIREGIKFASEYLTKFSQIVLIDKFEFDKEQAERFADEFNYLCDSFIRDYIDSNDIAEELDEVFNSDKTE